MLISTQIDSKKTFLRLAIIAGLAGLTLYLLVFSHTVVNTKIEHSSSALAPLDCSATKQTKVAYQIDDQPNSCLFTSCSGIFQ